eukprot:5762472-Amphidinium_carterae.1
MVGSGVLFRAHSGQARPVGSVVVLFSFDLQHSEESFENAVAVLEPVLQDLRDKAQNVLGEWRLLLRASVFGKGEDRSLGYRWIRGPARPFRALT